MKRALLVGINKYKNVNGLRGCLNDVERIRNILIKYYGFKQENIIVLLDEQATKRNILSTLEKLVAVSVEKDKLVYWQSSHGSQQPTKTDKFETDGMDEVLCTYDLDWTPMTTLIDNEIALIFSKLKKGVHVFIGLDCCHSGTADRDITGPARFVASPFPTVGKRIGLRVKLNETLLNLKPKIKSLAEDGAAYTAGAVVEYLFTKKRSTFWKGLLSVFSSSVTKKQDIELLASGPILLSGCRDNQTSADAFINGKYCGAMTECFAQALEKNPKGTYLTTHENTLKNLTAGRFEQVPQLSGMKEELSAQLLGEDI